MTRISFLSTARRNAARIAVLTLGAVSLSACAYGDYGGYGGVSYSVGTGYAGGFDPYCDGFSAYDSFYGCDVGYGFGQIGFGGGYWDNFYYPGYGQYIFDRPGGRRFAMQDRHRQYWGQQRWQYQQSRRANRQDFRQDRRDGRQDIRQDRRGDRRDIRQDRREDRRDWRQDRGGIGQGADQRAGQRQATPPAERQQGREMRQDRRQGAVGQPGQGRMRGEGRVRQAPPQQQAAPPRAERAPRQQAAPPRAERAPRQQRQQNIQRAPRGPADAPSRTIFNRQDIQED